MGDLLDFIKEHRVVFIYRGMRPEECLEVSLELAEVGIRLFEVTMNSPDTAKSIELLKTELGIDALIGAGTVIKTAQVNLAARSGASYIISPNANPEVIYRTKQQGLTSIAGAFTPTEIMGAWEAGADMVKVFPINVVGPEYIAQLRGPLDQIPFMATGGIRLEMVKDLFQAGTDAIGVGVHLLGKDLMKLKDWNTLRNRAAEFVEAAGVRTSR